MMNNSIPKVNINNVLSGQQNQSHKKAANRNTPSILEKVKSNPVPLLLLINAIFLGLLVFFQFNPPVEVKSNNQKIFDEVKEQVDISDSETPIISKIPDAAALRDTNAVMGEVYKNAEDGDYFVALSDKIIIYRNGDDEVIYNGPSPAQIIEERKRALISTIKNLAQEQNIPLDLEEVPELLAASDPEELKALDATFYAEVQSNDIIAVFTKSERIIIYRPSTAQIINQGAYSSSIVQ